jgi:SnoaL-like domain
MDSSQRAEIERQCRDLVLAVTQHGDHGEHAEAVSLFAEGGVWIRGGRPFTGSEELLASYGAEPSSQVTRHINGGSVITVQDEDNAQGVTYYLAYRHNAESEDAQLPLPLESPFSLGEWHDRFVRTDAGWRFAARETKRVFVRQAPQ